MAILALSLLAEFMGHTDLRVSTKTKLLINKGFAANWSKPYSEYINTHPLVHGDVILQADQWISNLLAWIGNLILAAKFCHLKNFKKLK